MSALVLFAELFTAHAHAGRGAGGPPADPRAATRRALGRRGRRRHRAAARAAAERVGAVRLGAGRGGRGAGRPLALAKSSGSARASRSRSADEVSRSHDASRRGRQTTSEAMSSMQDLTPGRAAAPGRRGRCRRPRRGTQRGFRPPRRAWDDWVESTARPGRARSSAATCSSRRSASTARRPAGCSPTSTRRRSRSASSRATRAPGQPRAQLRQGPGHAQPDLRPGAHPLSAAGAPGRAASGKWERVTWDEALDDIAGRIRAGARRGPAERGDVPRRPAGRRRLHRARPPGVGHRRPQLATPTSARPARALGYAFWMGFDRPSPDHANARFILLIRSHLETGHYFNPHAQRIIEGKMAGAKICRDRPAPVEHRLDGRLLAAAWPGSEAAMLLAIAHVLLDDGTLRPRVRAPLDELGGVPARRAARRCR